MAQQSPDYKMLFFEEQRRREEEQRRREVAERAQEEEQCRREEEQRRRENAEQAQEKAEEKTRKTSLPEFLDACHNHLYSGLNRPDQCDVVDARRPCECEQQASVTNLC
ncbi:uncharacterized protein BDZ99DRAFT_525587 [Mytilinidion resinicola]|uniref:Uncharacterized protein n=1 Tax=Mytilinidion resinicola TaxID=574789 RepID=A0A6A6Y6S0_9PEZI|nr:uncharacterized protein BDZ99DRAFT_525587 [Mytilinidion resinicola]KAF2804380.1 hypothetical protein BDZ99DRAFT_525587 [Mytilinidion resinicola]